MSLRFKLAVVVVVGVICAMVLAAFGHAWRDADRRLDFAREGLEAIAATLATAVALPLANSQYRDVQMILRSVRRMPHVKYVEVRGNSDDLIAAFGSAVVLDRDSALVRAFENPGLLALLSIKSYPVDVFVIEGSQQVGRLRVIGDVSHLSLALRESLNFALFAGLLASLAGFLIAYRFLGIVTYPITELTSAMRDVRASNDFTRKVKRRTADETGELVDAFNDMLEQIETRDLAIAQHTEGLEATVRDRTRELRHAVQAAEQANAAKSDFLATMSHEIRTPMNGMMGMAELLARSDLPQKQQRYADVILGSGQSLIAIINDILDLSKIEAGKLELEILPLDPREVAERVAALFAQRASQKGIEVRVEAAEDVPTCLMGDPVRLTQIVSNLVNNAIKFTESGFVSIEIGYVPSPDSNDAGTLKFEVSDTGIGIAQDKLDRIFEAFAQADQSTTRNYGGTGIGLSICRQLVDAMGGTITATSKPGEGATFAFTIPCMLGHPDVAGTPAQTACMLETTFPGVRILAADDATINREVLTEVLHRLDVEVISVENGRQALDALTNQSYDLVFLDGSMPVMDGYQAARAIRAMEREQQRPPTPIVALTAHVIGGRANRWREAGMDDCVTKPYNMADIQSCLAKLLPGRAVERQSTTYEPVTEPAVQTEPYDDASAMRGDIIDSSVIDGIREMSGGCGKLLASVIDLYATHAPKALAELKTAVAEADASAIAEKAHALKSLSCNIGALRVADACNAIETAAREDTACPPPQTVDRLATETETAIASLSKLRESAATPLAKAI